MNSGTFSIKHHDLLLAAVHPSLSDGVSAPASAYLQATHFPTLPQFAPTLSMPRRPSCDIVTRSCLPRNTSSVNVLDPSPKFASSRRRMTISVNHLLSITAHRSHHHLSSGITASNHGQCKRSKSFCNSADVLARIRRHDGPLGERPVQRSLWW